MKQERITWFNKNIEVSINRSKSELFKIIEENKKQYNWMDLAFGTRVDFTEMLISNDKIEIIRSPTALKAFRPTGKILISIEEKSADQCKLSCLIIPYNGMGHIVFSLSFGSLLLWTVGALLLGRTEHTWLMILFTWTIWLPTIYIIYNYNKWALVSYSRKIISELTTSQ